MQRGRGALDSFPEPIDLNQGSVPNNTSMDHSASWSNMLNPVENRLSNYMLASTDGNASCTNTAHECGPSFSGWDRGESSSSANMQDEDSKMRLGWSSSFYASESDSRGLGTGLPHSLYKSGHSEMDHIPTFYASSSNVGTSAGSSSTFSENTDASGSSFGTWGSSCKRKALEGTSGQFYPGGSSSSNQPMEKSIMQHPFPGCYSAPGNLSISTGPLNLSPTNHSEQLNPSGGFGMTRVAPGSFLLQACKE
ncbi:UNVERIFIED_CONTAM: hypothetical protein Sradi_2817000 [Sesamum radiatum]|uniref:Growth-regulating factor n=1 Tax=Sesamum radiatum TaxID=300843 RepID=A0AAW2RVJ4_SESRA